MNRIKETILQAINGMSKAIFRFPLTVLSLFGAAVLICYMISLNRTPSLIIEKLMFTLLVGAIIGMAAQFAVERLEKLQQVRPAVYGISVLLTAGYFLILWPSPEISAEITVRTLVAVFALICAVLWLPSYKEQADFNKVALIHFKSIFTSVLYAGVLTGGLAAIIAAIDILLFNVNNDTYSYMMTVVWVLFATIYYLSLLPKFNAEEELDHEVLRTAGYYPKFLDILVSYIAIPLISAYTFVLFAYFVKILVTRHWPSGQLGPMVLIYSAVGLVLFVLASLLENRFATLYRKSFPKVLIPVVVMQMISVWIRLNAYGVTESRYYVVLFGIFSIIIGLLLSIKPLTKNSIIALLAAGFAIFSVIPPVDAFTVSRASQINRVEKILYAEGMLTEGKLSPKENAAEESKVEITNILSYLERQSSLQYIAWLPKDFRMYDNMKTFFGFSPAYPRSVEWENHYFYAALDADQPINISEYDMSFMMHSNRFIEKNVQMSPVEFTIADQEYVLSVERISNLEARISIKTPAGEELIGTGLYAFAQALGEKGNEPKQAFSPEEMTLEVSRNNYKLKVVFQNINITKGSEPEAGVDYQGYVFFGDLNL